MATLLPYVTTSLTIDDTNGNRGHTAVLSASQLSDLAPAPIRWPNCNIDALTIDGGSGATRYEINGIPAATIINAGSGNDTFDVGLYAELFSLSIPALTLHGGDGTNSLDGPDGVNTWTIRGSDAGTLNGTLDFSAVASLTGGDASDDFIFANGARITGEIHGRGGINQLDYSAYRTGVYVNLLTGAATGTGGISNISQVFGSGTSDVLVGAGTGILLEETAGRNLMIGGAGGNATLDSGSGQDIVIAGSTKFDDDQTALHAIESYWAAYAGSLIPGCGWLVVGYHRRLRGLNASTVKDHKGDGDVLTLGSATDWLFWRNDGVDDLTGVAAKTTLI